MTALVLPFERWTSCGRLVVFLSSVIAFLVFGGAQGRCGKVMKRTGGIGVYGFEMIGTWAKADALLAKWRKDRAGLHAAETSLVLDVFFIAAYVVGVGVMAAAAGSYFTTKHWPGWHSYAVVVALVGAVVGGLDVIEDIGLGFVLVGKPHWNWPSIATGASKLKWALSYTLLPLLITLGMAVLP